MSFTHSITRSYTDSSGTPISSLESVSADTEFNFDGSIAGASDDVQINYAVTRANLKSLYLYCASALEVRAENATGVAITDVTDPGNVLFTAAGHGLSVGDAVRITGVGGAVNVNGQWYVSAVASSSTFEVSATLGGSSITTIDSAYTSGGTLYEQTVISLTAGQGRQWSLAQDGLASCPFAFNIGQLFAKNANVAAVTLKVRTLADQTP